MAESFQPTLDFEAVEAAAEAGEALVVDLDGFEGPLHVLLALARSQKVDLLRLSIARLADQYLAFVQEARKRRFAVAADYLVMAAWLTYLKSRLLLPKPERKGEEPPAQELAEALAFRLVRLEAVRKACDALHARAQLGRDVFARGDAEQVVVHATSRLEGSLYELMTAFVSQRRRAEARRYAPAARVEAYPLEAARERLSQLLPDLESWTSLGGIAPAPSAAATDAKQRGPSRASYLASTLSAGLEMVKDGRLEARQLQAFAEIWIRRAQTRPQLLAAE